jgi:hypothetical protein
MMYPKRFALTALLLALPCMAQPPAELMEKAIYTQETAGDLDGAIQIYRQITASAPSQSPLGAQAQFRIAEALLQKGDLTGAATEFSILATRYSEHQALIAKMATRLGGVQNQPAGIVQNGRYRNKRTGLEFPIPASWKTSYDGASSDDGDMVGVTDGSSMEFGVWMRPEVSTPAEIQDKLKGSPAAKVKMNADIPGFAFRPESIQNRIIGGQQALSAIADFVDNGKKMATIYTWIYTAKTHVVFIGQDVPAADVPAVQARLDQFVATAVVP